MSIVLITQHNETIYNITKSIGAKEESVLKVEKPVETPIAKQVAVQEKKYKCHLKNAYIDPRKIKSHGTMGLPKQPLPNPHDFLKKKTGKPPMLPVIHTEKVVIPLKGKMPPVPNRDEVIKEQDEKLKYEKKNFLCLNKCMAIKMTPAKPARRVTILNTGEVRDLSAGLEPQFLKSKLYGKIPPYLDNLIKIKQKITELQKEKEKSQQPKCIYITREEREELLAGLKANWDELQRIYQGLPILTDTIPKIHRKSKIESELKQLEKDIVLVERHPYIYVYDDENDL